MIIINSIVIIGALSFVSLFIGTCILVGSIRLTFIIMTNEVYAIAHPEVKVESVKRMFNNRARELEETNFRTFKKRLEDANGIEKVSEYNDAQLKKIKKTWIRDNKTNAQNAREILKREGLLNPLISFISSVRTFTIPANRKEVLGLLDKSKQNRKSTKKAAAIRIQEQADRLGNDNYGKLNLRVLPTT